MNDDDKTIKPEDEMNENNEMPENIDTQEESMEDTSIDPDLTDVAEDVVPTEADMIDDFEEDVEMPDEDDAASGTSDEDAAIPNDWIKVVDGKFTCSECENESEPETNTVDGTVKADTEQILADLKQFPTKIVYGSCPVCGMEYTFKEKGDELYMEPSDMIK